MDFLVLGLLKKGVALSVCGGSSGTAIYYTCGYDRDLIVFNFDGSSSMQSIMNFLMDEYKKTSSNGKNISMNISAVGSGMGLRSILNGTSEFALVSHDVKEASKNEYKEEWKKRKLKTISLAEEAILLLYKPNVGCTEDLVISKDNVKDIYSLMSGHVYDSSKLKKTLGELIGSGDKGNCNVTIRPWVKNSGPAKSGTAKAFVDNPLLKESDLCKDADADKCKIWLKKVKGGDYGKDVSLHYTPEPTPLHWESFNLNIVDGSMTYLPSSFVFLNWNFIVSKGIKVAKIKVDDSSSEVSLTRENYESQYSNYKWSRPFNLIYSVADISSNTNKKNLVESFITNSSKLKSLKLKVTEYKLKGSSSSGSSSATEIEIGKEDQLDSTS